MTSHLELFVWSCESVTDLPKHTQIMGLGVEGVGSTRYWTRWVGDNGGKSLPNTGDSWSVAGRGGRVGR